MTGASSGIGKAFAERLAADGYDLVAVARRGDRLEALAADLGERHASTVEVMVADLVDRDALRGVERRLAQGSPVDLLVNNAGFGAGSAFAELDPDVAERMIDLHLVASLRLARAALPGMIERGSGAVINVSSNGAFIGLPNIATYCASKAFLVTFVESIHEELAGTGVRAQALCPSNTVSEIWGENYDESKVSPYKLMATGDVVQASLVSLANDEAICAPSLDDAALAKASREARQRLLDRTRTGVLPDRYRP